MGRRRNRSRRVETDSRRKKNPEIETITAAELLASKFLSLIGKSTLDNDLKKNIRKMDMSVEAITDAVPNTCMENRMTHRKPRKKNNLNK